MDHPAEGLGEPVGADQASLRGGGERAAAEQHPAEAAEVGAGGAQPRQHRRHQGHQRRAAGGPRHPVGVEPLVDLQRQPAVPGAGHDRQPGHAVQRQAAEPAVALAGVTLLLSGRRGAPRTDHVVVSGPTAAAVAQQPVHLSAEQHERLFEIPVTFEPILNVRILSFDPREIGHEAVAVEPLL